jgi:putative endonuclease
MYYVYLIQCEDDSIYTGITTDIERRLKEHRNHIGSRYTSSHNVKKLLYSEKFPTRSKALKREAEIKKWRREEKLNLIRSNNSRTDITK